MQMHAMPDLAAQERMVDDGSGNVEVQNDAHLAQYMNGAV